MVTRRRGSGNGASRTSTKAERLDRATLSYITQRAIYIDIRRSQKVAEFDQVLDIMPDDLDTLVLNADLHKRRPI